MARIGTSQVLRVLLVEDSRAEAILIEKALSDHGGIACQVEQVQNVAAAVQALESSDFDLVLLDLGLPDSVGFSGLHDVQATAPKVPVIVLTGRDDALSEREAMEQGAQDYVLKTRASAQVLARSMRHAIQRKQIDNLKSEFVSVVSHELRTPLTAINGALGLITGALNHELSAPVERLVAIAHANSERLIRLVEDIMDIDRIDSGQMRFEMQAERLQPILAQVIDRHRDQCRAVQVDLTLRPVAADLCVHVDADRLGQAIGNLLSNAAKFSLAGAEVTVSAERIDGAIRIAVSDTGVGIAASFRDRIFDRFSQADSSLHRTAGGAGVGLYIARQMIEHMNGTIDFESEPGAGTTFRIDLPEASAPEMPINGTASAEATQQERLA